MPLEYFFGTLRTALNSDQLSVNAMLELVEKSVDLEALADRNGWGRWSSQKDKEASSGAELPLADDMSDTEFLGIGHEMSVVAHLFLRTMGWRQQDIYDFQKVSDV